MKNYKVITILFCCLIVTQVYTQNRWRVNNMPGINANFSDLQAAFDAASPGDIIYLEGTNIPYPGSTLSKRLILIGPGYFLAVNDSTQANISSAIITSIIIGPGSDGSYLAGLVINDLSVRSNNLIVERNNIGSITISFPGVNVSNVIIRQNYVSSINDNDYAYSTALIQNNILNSVISGGKASWSIRNNSFNLSYGTAIQVYNSAVKNNIIQNLSQYSNHYTINTEISRNNSIIGNICNKPPSGLPQPDHNIWNANMSDVWVLTGSAEEMFYLKEGSPAIGYGENGIDCGVFGGSTPYVLSGMPPVPHIFQVDIPVSVSTTGGLPVNVKIKSQK